MATLVEVTGASYPASHDGHDVLPMEGRSLLPAFNGDPDISRVLIFEHERNAALREGAWKIVAQEILGKTGLQTGKSWRLHNVVEDPAEQHNLADEHPQIVQRLSDLFVKEAHRTLILPAP
jgi:arylsulfatase